MHVIYFIYFFPYESGKIINRYTSLLLGGSPPEVNIFIPEVENYFPPFLHSNYAYRY